MRKLITALYLTLSFSYGLLAQETSSQDTSKIATEKVEVIKNYEAIIQQARQKDIKLNPVEKETVKIDYNYKIKSEARLDFDRPKEVVRPLSFNERNTQEDIKDGSIYGGYGNFKSLNAGLAYHYYIEDWIEAGIKYDHFSADDTALPFQQYNNNEALIYASYLLNKKTKIGIDGVYGSSDHYTNQETPEDNIVTQQALDKIGGHFNLASNVFESVGLAFRARAGFEQIKQDADAAKENKFSAEANLFKSFGDNIHLELPFVYTSYTAEVGDSVKVRIAKTYDINLAPKVRIEADKYNAALGVQYINAKDTSFIFPIIDIYISDIYESLDIQFYTQSSFNRNSIGFLSDINPYYRTDLSNYSPNFMASYNLKLIYRMRDLKASLNMAYADYTGDHIFFDRSDTNRAIANGLDRNEIAFRPVVEYNKGLLSAQLSYDYRIFLDNTGSLAFYRPKSHIQLITGQSLNNGKIKLGQQLNYVSARKHAHPDDNDRTLDAYLDLSLTADIVIMKSLSLYFRASNLLGQDYEIWYGHPVFQRQIWGGLRINI